MKTATHCSHTKQTPTEDLREHPRNVNQHSREQIELLAKIIDAQGWRNPIVVSSRSGFIVAGHARLLAAKKLGLATVPVDEQDFETDEAELAHLLADNRIAELAEIDADELAKLIRELDGKIDLDLTGFGETDLIGILGDETEAVDAEPQVDRADELRKKWNVKLGQIWQLGDHRLICGDSTSSETVGRLMDGGKAVLLHADPPYGMGKENEGIANDNLYRDKLDAFQMDWWRACRPSLADNGSAYIWGNAPDLWRLWYVGGLADSERLTVRNEIVWEKKTALGLNAGNGIGSSLPRQFANLSERCLFFMLGEQGFNSNADNYWEGFDPIRKYLDGERRAMGWDMKTIAAWFGFHPRMADHWFSVSQWSFIRPEQYARLQAEAKGDAFKREHDDLKREHDDLKREHDDLKRDFYATRAYFDNTHDNMTDVWQFDRVSGEERQGHATPKPVEMMGRVMKSSARAGDLVIEPFIGSGSTLIAAENTGRHCRGIEIDPAYVAVTIERWHEATGKEPEQIK